MPLRVGRFTAKLEAFWRQMVARKMTALANAMHILMIAPEPFFEPRGTPFSEYHRLRALSSMGHTVDFVTYPFGSDEVLPGLRIIRSRARRSSRRGGSARRGPSCRSTCRWP